MRTLGECDASQLRKALRGMPHYVWQWADNTARDIMEYIEGVGEQLERAESDEEARRIVATAFLDEDEFRKLMSAVRAYKTGAVGLVGVGLVDILGESGY